jgi:hypothetical protein
MILYDNWKEIYPNYCNRQIITTIKYTCLIFSRKIKFPANFPCFPGRHEYINSQFKEIEMVLMKLRKETTI